MKYFTKVICGAILATGLVGPAIASSVFLVGDSDVFRTNQDNEVLFQNIFNGKSVLNDSSSIRSLSGLGTTATETGGVISAANLAGKDFLMTGFNRTSYSASEIADISAFVNGGGSLFLYGEGNTAFTVLNTALNGILSAVGSTMSLSTTANLDTSGFTTLSSFTGATAFASGVSSWTTAYTSEINLGSGTAVISGIADTQKFGTFVAVENLAAVPVPASLPLLLAALGVVGIASRRRKSA